MTKLMVYYNPGPDYDGEKNMNANIWISINGSHVVDPITANTELIEGDMLTTLKQKEEYDPVGIFSKNIATYNMPDGKTYGYGAETIDYKTITPKELKQELQHRLTRLSQWLKDPDIEIDCSREVPPT